MNEIEIMGELFRLRSILNTISDTSFNYKQIFKKYPLDTLTGDEGIKMIEVYKSLIETVENALKEYKK